MTNERSTAEFRAHHLEIKHHLEHVRDWIGALPSKDPAEQRATVRRVVTFFEEHIGPHAEWEEQFLYPLVDRLAGSGANAFTSTMRYEHRIVGRWIGELRAESESANPDPAMFARRTDNLLGLLWAHFEEEEEVLLPFLDRAMSRAEVERELGGSAGAH